MAKSSIFWYITPCSLLKVKHRFGETCELHLQHRRTSQERKQLEADKKQSVMVDPECGGDIFLRKFG
jgi:hypothetical protein